MVPPPPPPGSPSPRPSLDTYEKPYIPLEVLVAVRRVVRGMQIPYEVTPEAEEALAAAVVRFVKEKEE